jgi:tetratricopeptide (TPR) repeat protein
MSNKIEWFQEVLSLEPGSRVFFPLARLYVEIGELENAAVTLSKGLDRHPEHLEARMLHIQVLADLGRTDEAVDARGKVVGPLREYPAFWRLWAQSQPAENRDFSVFLMLVSAGMQGEFIHWSDIMLEGVKGLSERLVGPLPEPAPRAEPEASAKAASQAASAPVAAPEASMEAAKVPPGILRTRTMADVLAAQGDYSGALDIYRELWGRAPEATREDLSERIRRMEAGMAEPAAAAPEEDAFSKHAKNRLISTLETLAARFEARVRS